MLRKLSVPTRLPKDYLLKYFNENTCYSNLPNKHKKKHNPHFSNVLCKFFAKDNCARGTDCIFSHDASQFPCVEQSQRLVCTKPRCQYRHDSTDSDTSKGAAPAHHANDNPVEKKLFISPFL